MECETPVSPTKRNKVAHLRRTYLLKREPFIGYQVTSHVEFESIVLCKQKDTSGGYANVPIHCSDEALDGFQKKVSDVLYQRFRILSTWEFKYLEDVIRREKPDILHCHYLPDARFFLKLKRTAKIPLVVSAYGYDTSEFHRRLLGYGKRYLAPVVREADLVLAMSPDMERDLRQLGCPPEKIRVHYYGVETSEFAWPERSYERSGIITLLMVAGLDEYKGHIYFLQALAELLRRLPATQFRARLAGEGPLENELKAYVRKSGLDSVVEFVGFVPRANGAILQEFREADVLVMPSVTQKNGLKEGIPGALVEAMASGLPCIGTRHAGIPFVLSDEETGLLVDERDVSGLVKALERLMTDADLRRRLGSAAARKAASEFNRRQKIRDLEAIYLSLLG